jgi:hypothetical protein
MKVRDRIKELRRVRASKLMPDPKNLRVGRRALTRALTRLLTETSVFNWIAAQARVAAGE